MQIYIYVDFLWHIPFGPSVQLMLFPEGRRADLLRRVTGSWGREEEMLLHSLFWIPAIARGNRLWTLALTSTRYTF